jgi:hypothetical protein
MTNIVAGAIHSYLAKFSATWAGRLAAMGDRPGLGRIARGLANDLRRDALFKGAPLAVALLERL